MNGIESGNRIVMVEPVKGGGGFDGSEDLVGEVFTVMDVQEDGLIILSEIGVGMISWNVFEDCFELFDEDEPTEDCDCDYCRARRGEDNVFPFPTPYPYDEAELCEGETNLFAIDDEEDLAEAISAACGELFHGFSKVEITVERKKISRNTEPRATVKITPTYEY